MTDVRVSSPAAAANTATADESRRWQDGALARAEALYSNACLSTGEPVIEHARGMLAAAEALELDPVACHAAVFFAAADFPPHELDWLSTGFGDPVADLVRALARLKHLRPLIAAEAGADRRQREAGSQAEVLRKMLLAMATDIRVVVLRLLSRAQSLRWFATQIHNPDLQEARQAMARETMDVYAPLANRLGVWQVKWELEDLSFRFLHPETYKHIAGLIDEKRGERQNFIARVTASLRDELASMPELAGAVEVYGRPKHIYSIWNKMQSKKLDFDQVYDVRAIRVIVPAVRDCYTVLGIVHHLWVPISGEFDDYISHPKGNHYRSLHTAVMVDDGRPLEIQIRTPDMHRHAELGVAAHWRYKEAGQSAKVAGDYEDKIAWLRQLLSWRDDMAGSIDWAAQFKRAALDDMIYVITPQGRVIDLAVGATPIDFAYRLHTDLGHRCRGAKIDGQMVPLDRPLKNGQTVEIVATKQGGPSRDWLNPSQGYLATHRAKQKVRQWFAAQEIAEQLVQGRAIVTKELQRLGESHAGMEVLATKLGLKDLDSLFLAAARGDIGPRAISVALHGDAPAALPEMHTTRSKADKSGSGRILIVGVDKLMTQMARCCKPMPPDAISGFVTRGRGVSIHRLGCKSFANMVARNPERVISAEWGVRASQDALYPVELQLTANDRVGLLRDISDVFSKEHIGVTAMNTQSRRGGVLMTLTAEFPHSASVQRVITLLGEVSSVTDVRRV